MNKFKPTVVALAVIGVFIVSNTALSAEPAYGTNSGENSIAIGTSTKAEGILGIAIGSGNASNAAASASGEASIAIGMSTVSSGNKTVALGSSAQATGGSAVALGPLSIALADLSIAVGRGSVADRSGSVTGFSFNGEADSTIKWKFTVGAFSVGSNAVSRELPG